MKDPIYRLIELTGTSTTSLEDAIVRIIQYAYDTIKSLWWFQVDEPRGESDWGNVGRCRVTVKVGYTVSS
jgi:flavin-binding protein dodecin